MSKKTMGFLKLTQLQKNRKGRKEPRKLKTLKGKIKN